jgi:hypothetical protein
LCIGIAGALAGFAARDAARRRAGEEEAGDTHAHLPPLERMRTADRDRIERESARLMEQAIERQRRKVRAGPLKPSYDARRDNGPAPSVRPPAPPTPRH